MLVGSTFVGSMAAPGLGRPVDVRLRFGGVPSVPRSARDEEGVGSSGRARPVGCILGRTPEAGAGGRRREPGTNAPTPIVSSPTPAHPTGKGGGLLPPLPPPHTKG